MSDLIHITCPACQAKNRIPAAKLGARPTCGVCKAQLLPEAPFELDEAKLDKHLKNDELPLLVVVQGRRARDQHQARGNP